MMHLLLFATQLTLADLERMALEKNPALAQSAAGIQAAEGRRLQSGMYPNPTVGLNSDEISPGPVTRYGEWGGFIEQRIVTGGKLGLQRKIADQDIQQARHVAQSEKQRVLSSLRMLYYQALSDQLLIEVRTEMSKIAATSVRISKDLANIGITDQPDLLAADIEAQRVELSLQMARNAQSRTWRQLSALVNHTLIPQPLDGDLSKLPQVDLAAVTARLEQENPSIGMARTSVVRSELALRRERLEPIPDLQVRTGLRYNRELLEANRRPVGLETFLDLGVKIPIFDRNQGNIAAARAERERSKLEAERIGLNLRSRLAGAFKEYQDGMLSVDALGKNMIPKAQLAYELYLGNFRKMAASYPQVLMTQRNLFQLKEDYAMALANVWRSAMEIEALVSAGM